MKIRSISVLITLALITTAARHSVFAVSPAPDGGYPGNNTAEGIRALFSLTSGVNNTALGFAALAHDTSGSNNTAEGLLALFANTTGAANTATGVQALYSNSTGIRNTADGTGALLHNNSSYNTATGWAALVNNTSGSANTADGAQALYFNTIGTQNTAVGAGAPARIRVVPSTTPMVISRSRPMQTATKTMRWAIPRFSTISTALVILPLVISRSRIMIQPETPLETLTRPLALRRSSTILMAVITQSWVDRQDKT